MEPNNNYKDQKNIFFLVVIFCKVEIVTFYPYSCIGSIFTYLVKYIDIFFVCFLVVILKSTCIMANSEGSSSRSSTSSLNDSFESCDLKEQ